MTAIEQNKPHFPWLSGPWLYCFIPLALAALSYNGLLNDTFTNWDDDDYVVNNPLIRQLSFEGIRHIFSVRTLVVGNYQPMTILSLAVNYAMGGLNPKVYIATDILLHLCNILLVFFFIRKLTFSNRTAGICALLFSVHPMHVESVAWISSRKDVLYAFFFLASLLFYLRYRENKGPGAVAAYWTAVALSLASLLSKSAAVTLPAILLLIDYYQKRKFSAALLRDKIPFFFGAAVFGFLAIQGQQREHAMDSGLFSPVSRALIAGYSYMFYLVKFVIPLKLSACYPYPPPIRVALWPLAYKVSPVGVIASVGAVAFFRHYRAVVFGYLFFLVSIIFIVHFIPVGSTITADRFSYVAYIGLSVIAAAGCEFLLSHMPLKGRTAFAAAAGILVASVLTFASWERCRVWKDSVTLWTDVVGKEQQGAGDAYLGNEHLGAALVRTGRAEEGMSHLLKAVAADPTYAFDHDNLGNALSQLNRLDEAIREYRTALHLNPSYTHAHLDLANALRQLGRSDEAIAEYRATLAIDPGNAMANNNLAGMLHGLGRIDDAVALCRKAVALEPQSMEANFNLGIALMQVKRAVEADSFFRAAVAVAPSDLGTLNRLCQSFMKMGRTDLAVSAAGKAMALAKSTGQDDLAQAIAQNIEDMKRSGRGP